MTDPESTPDEALEEPPARTGLSLSPRSTLLFAVAIPSLLFFTCLTKSGIWDPPELTIADLARRVAINAFGAKSLELGGAENGMPHLGDLGRNELPVDSIAFGFRLFGLHEWSGRLPLAIWGLVGVLAVYAMLARLVDRKAGLYGALVLSTMPLYFIQARTMLGDIVTMASVSVAFAGLSIAAFDRGDRADGGGAHARVRVAAIVAGALGLLSGFLSRGLLIGVAMPALGVGLAWAVSRAGHDRGRAEPADPIAAACGAAALVVGAVSAAWGLRTLLTTTSGTYSMLVGAPIQVQSKFPTFDFVIHWLGHSLFPWSAFIPFAVGRMFREPPRRAAGAEGDAAEAREADLRLALLIGAAVAFGVYSAMAPRVGHLAFGAPALLAAIAAVAIRDYELGAPPSRAVAVGVAILAALFLRDYQAFPEKGLSAFAVAQTTFPESFKERAGKLVAAAAGLFVGLVFLAWMERGSDRQAFRRDDYEAWPRALARAFGGYLAFFLVVLEAAFAGLALITYLGMNVFRWKQVLTMGVQVRVAMLNAFWVAPAALFLVVWGTMAARDAFRTGLSRLAISRGHVTVAAGVLAGALMSFVYYPALAAQLSPREVLESYGRLHKDDQPLGLLNVGGRAANYYASGEVKTFTDTSTAYSWLTSDPRRRWMVVRNEDLGRMNSLWRGRAGIAKQNLPVLDAQSSQILLVSNVIEPGERNESPFADVVLDREPHPQYPIDAILEDKLQAIGWEVLDRAGKRVEKLVPTTKYRFRIYYKVLTQVTGEWETFIHIDGQNRRFNGDHKTLGGKYAFSLWQPGDCVVDDAEVALEPNFTPGSYRVFFGLFTGETRMKVKSGKHDDNRIDGGSLLVQ